MLYLLSDLHLGHGNIIEYEDRPFTSESEMDTALIANWNAVVQPDDTVLYGGDLTLARESKALEYLEQLNGEIHFIYGNHDKLPRNEVIPLLDKQLVHTIRFSYDGFVFYYTHWPQNLPTVVADERVWKIHGHVHGSEEYPFIDQENRRVNVSVEKVNYKPISIEEIIAYIRTGETYHSRP